jgi:nucleotide-binding universal stress UspA family protein
MTQRILIAVDGSDASLRAVDYCIAQRDVWRAPPALHLLHVHAPIPVGRVQAHIGHDTLHAYYREEGEQCLQAAQARLDAAGYPFTVHLHVGQAPEVIVHQAQVLACDQIVLGSHGRSALSALVLGSVTARVLQLADRPVLVIK